MAVRTSRVKLAGKSLVQKILQKHVVGSSAVLPGDYVSLRPWRTMTHDNSFAVIEKFRALGATSVHDKTQLVFALDHDIQNKSEENLAHYAAIEAFAQKQGVDFYPAGRGIGHQIMVEELYAEPGSLCVASDSHSNMYGGVGCLGTPVVRTDAAGIWCTGRTWWRIPPIVHVELQGQLPAGCCGKDVIIALCGFLNEDQVLNHAVEFGGEGVSTLSVEDRLTIANMSTEWGALCGVFPVDDKTLDWWHSRASIVESERPGATPLASAKDRAARARNLVEELQRTKLQADDDAIYAKRYVVDLSKLSPLITGGNTLKEALIAGADPIRIHKAWLVSCVNARATDIAVAAKALRDRKVAPGVEFYVAAASSEVQATAEAAGDWQVLLDAGAIELPPGCGACAGLGAGTIKKGEVGIAATNRNFRGRMGSRDGIVYLASPAVVAASAAAGKIVPPVDHPAVVSGGEPASLARGAVTALEATQPKVGSCLGIAGKRIEPIELVDGFPHMMCGDLIWCGADNISTDGIYHAKHMYRQLTGNQMADVAMENYDPDFRRIVRSAQYPILAAGDNFGTGSSREQAAQCFKYLGLSAVLAGSFSATYTRNAVNNGMPLLEAPELISFLKEMYGTGTESRITRPTVVTGLFARLNFRTWTVELETLCSVDQPSVSTFPMVPMGQAAQEMFVCGGLERWIAEQVKKKA